MVDEARFLRKHDELPKNIRLNEVTGGLDEDDGAGNDYIEMRLLTESRLFTI